MTIYNAPVEEMMFLFNHLKDNKNYNEIEKFKEINSDLVKDILEQAAKLNQEIVHPLAKAGDESPCVYENGVVRSPPGYKEAYTKFINDGWTSLSCDPKYGGQGMPKTVSTFFEEMLSSASLSFKLYSELSIGAYNCILHHANDEIKKKFLPRIVEGKWSGTMCLTESHCGTDLGMIRTKAEPISEYEYRITGQKIFISSGDHDLSKNIIHLVLAKVPGGPDGVKGISLFIVPKFLVNTDGNLGERNNLSVGSIEKKMGIHANATCVLNYDGATGYLLGEKHKGLQAMFTMMNNARLGVGVQGVSQAERAIQKATFFAKSRKQGKAIVKNGTGSILDHADVRRNMLIMKALTFISRCICLEAAVSTDFSKVSGPSKMPLSNQI